MRRLLVALLGLILLAHHAEAQPIYGPPLPSPFLPDSRQAISDAIADGTVSFNPMSILDSAGAVLQSPERPPTPAPTRDETDGNGRGLTVALNILVLLTILTLAPAVVLMTTCFVRIMIVLGLLKQAMGTNSIPPPQIITGLAMFMTAMVMAPTIDRVWSEGIQPWQAGEITDYGVLWDKTKQPLRDFMFDQIEATGNWSSVYMMLNYQGVDTSSPESLTRADVDMAALVPAYMLSELKVAFLMGFRVYLPFLVIDMVIASILISMSMMMLPPVMISLPFKLLLFILVDGWTLVVGSLLESFVQDGYSHRMSTQAAVLILLPIAIRNHQGVPGRARSETLEPPMLAGRPGPYFLLGSKA